MVSPPGEQVADGGQRRGYGVGHLPDYGHRHRVANPGGQLLAGGLSRPDAFRELGGRQRGGGFEREQLRQVGLAGGEGVPLPAGDRRGGGHRLARLPGVGGYDGSCCGVRGGYEPYRRGLLAGVQLPLPRREAVRRGGGGERYQGGGSLRLDGPPPVRHDRRGGEDHRGELRALRHPGRGTRRVPPGGGGLRRRVGTLHLVLHRFYG